MARVRKVKARLRRRYLWLWREPDTSEAWPIIFANLKFATFNLCIALVMVAAKAIMALS